MNAMGTTTEQLNELIAITRDGERLYEHARKEVKDPELRELFSEMCQAKKELIQALAAKVEANKGEPESGRTLTGTIRQVYADIKAELTNNDATTYISQLEKTEDRILHAFEDALENADVGLHSLLGPEIPKVRACHDRMRDLKKAIGK